MPALINPFLGSTVPKTLLEMITDAGLLTNLAICLDAADAASYDGTSQTWFDVSGNNQNFYRGSGAGSQSSDPTFNGVAGNKSFNEYFSVDGGDFFQETANTHNFAESWHKDNAAFTFGFVLYAELADLVVGFPCPIFGNYDASSGPGVLIYGRQSTNELTFIAVDGTDPIMLIQAVKTTFLSAGRKWVCVIFSLDEAAGNLLTKSSGAAPSLQTGVVYSTPSVLGTGEVYRIMSSPFADLWPTGVRLATMFAWNRVLSSAELDAMYSALQQRYTTLL